jgi:4-hydroxy-3-methylbut-2-enyl diphosphate reductase
MNEQPTTASRDGFRHHSDRLLATPAEHGAVTPNSSPTSAYCPLVSKVHAEARRFTAQGQTADDAVSVNDKQRVAYLTQTALATDDAEAIVEVLRGRFPGLQAPPDDDICYATTNRQNAVRAVAAKADLVLVVGSTNSSNSRRLVDVARREGVAAWLIEDATQLRSEWFETATTIGLTADASAPPRILDGVLDALRAIGPLSIEELSTTTESVYFAHRHLPAVLDSETPR